MTTLSPIIRKAMIRASFLHNNQKRKVGSIPFITHPFAVAYIVSKYSLNEELIASAFLHDVLEDISPSIYSVNDMRNEFGNSVTDYVLGVTEESVLGIPKETTKITWKRRKEQYIANLDNASKDILILASADKIHNMQSFIDDYAVYGDKVWEPFTKGVSSCSWFYGTVLELVKEQLDSPIVKEYDEVYQIFVKMFHSDLA